MLEKQDMATKLIKYWVYVGNSSEGHPILDRVEEEVDETFLAERIAGIENNYPQLVEVI